MYFTAGRRQVANTVNGNAVYTALWEIDANHNGVADKDEDTYTIIYTDGVEEETIFPDQVYDGLLSGTRHSRICGHARAGRLCVRRLEA